MSNESLVAIICALVAAHYLSLVWEIRKIKDDLDALRKAVTDSALAAANAATAAAQVAQRFMEKQ